MLDKIRSSYIIQIFFSKLNERAKLKLIKYNKKLQKILNINILHYKMFSEKHIIYESKGKGKEYNEYGGLLYEGEYLNGERNGIGKEYDESNLIFEGEYLYNQRKKENIILIIS